MNRETIIETLIEEEWTDRLDTMVSTMVSGWSRSKINQLCKEQRVFVNGVARKPSFQVGPGDLVQLTLPALEDPLHIEPEDLPLDIIYEDPDILVINKPAGMVVHPGAGVTSGTLVNALAHYTQTLAQRGGTARPGLVHRLDKGTSGLILVAKHDEAHAALSDQWQSRSVIKVYQCLAWGKGPNDREELQTTIGRHPTDRKKMAANVIPGKDAVSRIKTLESYPEAAYLNVQILTGRTHQIRVHLAFRHSPVIGDSLYGGSIHQHLKALFSSMPDRPMLHAALLAFSHPRSGEALRFQLHPPSDFMTCRQALRTFAK
jgi:23S rRNA pseudouridine1911/1915/1917 synthase